MQICTIDDCDRQRDAKGMCALHYNRWKRHGDPLAGRTPKGTGLTWIDQVALTLDTDDCIEWPYYRDANGYGKIFRTKMATQVTLERAGRPRPEGDSGNALHSCDNPPCCNPRHLRWGTKKENTQDAVERRRFPSMPSEEIIQYILESPKGNVALARELGLHRTTILRHRKKHGLTSPSSR